MAIAVALKPATSHQDSLGAVDVSVTLGSLPESLGDELLDAHIGLFPSVEVAVGEQPAARMRLRISCEVGLLDEVLINFGIRITGKREWKAPVWEGDSNASPPLVIAARLHLRNAGYTGKRRGHELTGREQICADPRQLGHQRPVNHFLECSQLVTLRGVRKHAGTIRIVGVRKAAPDIELSERCVKQEHIPPRDIGRHHPSTGQVQCVHNPVHGTPRLLRRAARAPGTLIVRLEME